MKGKKHLDSNAILNTLEQHKDMLRKFGLKRIGLFGSYLKGKNKSRSDIDFIVVFDKVSFDNYMDRNLP